MNDVEVGSAGGEVSEEVQRVRVRRKPEEPTREEVEEHNVDHAQ